MCVWKFKRRRSSVEWRMRGIAGGKRTSVAWRMRGSAEGYTVGWHDVWFFAVWWKFRHNPAYRRRSPHPVPTTTPDFASWKTLIWSQPRSKTRCRASEWLPAVDIFLFLILKRALKRTEHETLALLPTSTSTSTPLSVSTSSASTSTYHLQLQLQHHYQYQHHQLQH